MQLAARRADAFAGFHANIDEWAKSRSDHRRLARIPAIERAVSGEAGRCRQQRRLRRCRRHRQHGRRSRREARHLHSVLPKAARWQSEVLVEELALRHDARLIMSTLESMTRLMERAETLTSPESIANATDLGTASIRAERIVIAALDRMRASALAYLTTERQAVLADSDSQIRAALGDIDRQRNLTMEQAEDLRKQTFIAADGMRRQTVDDIDRLANRIILRVALTVAALLALAALLGFVVLRTTLQRRHPTDPLLPRQET